MTTFYLIRHGARESLKEDSPLSPLGIKQAEACAYQLTSSGIGSIYTSPLKRTLQTAKIIAHALRLHIKSDNRLKERLIWGDRPGESYDEFVLEWIKTSNDRNYKPPYGDTSFEAGNRVKSLIDEVADSGVKNILVVAHGGIIGDFLRNIFSEDKLVFQIDPKSSVKYIEILECSITEIQKANKKHFLKSVNDISHFPLSVD